MNIAWIGTGVMGKAMLNHLIDAGHQLNIYNRTLSKLDGIKANKFDNIRDCVEDVDYVFTMVGYPKDVEEVYLGQEGILENINEGVIVVDMTTSSPELAKRIYDRHPLSLDAPVSGGDSGAKNATLSIMVGGELEVFDKVKPLLEIMGKDINLIGPAGYGQHCKMCNQIAVAGATAAYSEALVYMQNVGLDCDKVLNAISSGAAGSWQLTNMAPRVLNGDLNPGFFIKHFTKDMRIAKEEMAKRNVNLDMLDSVYKMYDDLENNGNGDLGTQALLKYYEE